MIGAALGADPRIEARPARPGEILRYVADIAKAGTMLGYRPRLPLREGLTRALAWQREWRELGQPTAD